MTTRPETSTNSVANLRDAYGSLCKAGLEDAWTSERPLAEMLRASRDFAALAHAHQDPPQSANNGSPWTAWLVLGGRGAGKTRLGAEWVNAIAHGAAPYADRRHRHIALVGESEHDVREVMIEGVCGILKVSPRAQRPTWIASRRRLEWPNGAVAQAFSAEDPESLRGPQCTPRAASSMSAGLWRSWRIRCATSASTASRRPVRRTVSTRWCGR